MTRKDYQAFADAIRSRVEFEQDMKERAEREDGAGSDSAKRQDCYIGGIQLATVEMVRVFQRDNPRFDKRSFLVACNLEHLHDSI